MSILFRESIRNHLRGSIGFRRIAPAQLSAGLAGSRRVVAAHDGDRVVGMARLLWDGGMAALITDAIYKQGDFKE